MWALNTPPASVRLFTDLPLAHFEDARERTGNELGHTFSAFSCFFCLAAFSRLPLSLTCPDPSTSLHRAERVGVFFPSRIQFPLRPSRVRKSECVRERPSANAQPAFVLITALSQRCAPFTQGRDSIRTSDITFIQLTWLHQPGKNCFKCFEVTRYCFHTSAF